MSALSVIGSSSMFAGSVESFDESMILLESLLGEQGVSFDAAYLPKNVMPLEPTAKVNSRERIVDLLRSSTYACLADENMMDIELYKHVNRMVVGRFSELESSQQRLEEFRDRCLRLASNPVAKKIRVPPKDDWFRVT